MTTRVSITALALDLTKHRDASVRAIGWNLLREERISDERLEHFFRVTGLPRTGDDLRRALVDYHRDWVCERPDETYNSFGLNGQNFVAPSAIPESLGLVSVVNITSWVERLRVRRRTGVRIERLYAKLVVGSSEPNLVEDLMALVIDGINGFSSARPRWVANAQEFSASIEVDAPATWNMSVGVWRLGGSWQAVMNYPAKKVPKLIRPSQLDSGYNQFHFPSPPCCAQPRGGLTMALTEDMHSGPLISEWIHEPTPLELEDWRAGGQLLATVGDGSPSPVTVYRSHHRTRLSNEFGGPVMAWLPLE